MAKVAGASVREKALRATFNFSIQNGLFLCAHTFPFLCYDSIACYTGSGLKDDVFSVSDTGIHGLKEKSEYSTPNRSRTYDLPISTSDPLSLSYRRLVVARPLNYCRFM